MSEKGSTPKNRTELIVLLSTLERYSHAHPGDAENILLLLEQHGCVVVPVNAGGYDAPITMAILNAIENQGFRDSMVWEKALKANPFRRTDPTPEEVIGTIIGTKNTSFVINGLRNSGFVIVKKE